MNHRANWRNVVIVALSLAVPAWSAMAQQEQQFAPQAEQQPGQQPAEIAGSDVPSRVARLNYFDGTVTFQPAGGNEWAYAELNRPMTTGDQVWVDNGGRSELHIGSTALRLGQQTAVSIVNLDDQNAQLKLAQGTLSTRLRNLPAGQSFEVDTPNVALQADGPGSYRIEAAPDGASTTVTVRDGSLTAYGDTGSVQIGAGQQLTFTGTNLQEAGGGTAPPPDAFESWAVSRDRAEDASVSARYVSRDVPGYQDLDANGTWEESPDYGQVWVPRVAAGWAPYREGHWAWVAPWGWTWVDDAPWGFAPFHYGRWAYYRNNWAWVPGPVVVTEPPCYAPALVAFVGGGNGGPGWGVSLTVGAVAAGVAWLPLGPGEPWRPAYHYSPRYYNRVNYVNHTTIVNNVHNTYINRGAPRAITGMPANQFVRGQGAGRYGQTLRPQQIARNSIGAGAPSIAPVRQSFGSGLRPANFRPPQTAGARPVIATRNAPTPFAYRDSLAQRFAKSGGRVQGAGQPVVRTAPPANFARIANAPGQPRGAAQPAFRVVPAERRPMPAQAQANRGGTPNGMPPNQVREGQQRGPQGPGQPQAQTGQRQGQFSGQTPGQAAGDLRPGQLQFQPGQRPGQTEADQRRDALPTQGGVRPGQPARPGQQQSNPINGEHQPGQAGRPGDAPVQGQMPRENGVPHPPDRALTGRPGEQPGNAPQRGERGQAQGQPQQEQQRGQQQAEQQQRAQQNEQQQRAQQAEQQRSQQQQGQQQAAQQQRAQQAEQQRSQQQGQQQAAQQQRAQQAEQQRSQQQQAQQQAAQQQRAQQAEQQRSQQQQGQQQAAQQQRAQQAEQQRSQQQRAQQAEQQRSQQQQAQQQAAQQQRAQQAEQQRAQQQQAQQQAAQQQRAQQAEQQRAQQQQAQQQAAQQQAAQQAQQRAQQQAEQQQRQQAAAQQMQSQQRQQQQQMQQQQQQQRRAEPPRPGSARESQRNDQQHG